MFQVTWSLDRCFSGLEHWRGWLSLSSVETKRKDWCSSLFLLLQMVSGDFVVEVVVIRPERVPAFMHLRFKCFMCVKAWFLPHVLIWGLSALRKVEIHECLQIIETPLRFWVQHTLREHNMRLQIVFLNFWWRSSRYRTLSSCLWWNRQILSTSKSIHLTCSIIFLNILPQMALFSRRELFKLCKYILLFTLRREKLMRTILNSQWRKTGRYLEILSGFIHL